MKLVLLTSFLFLSAVLGKVLKTAEELPEEEDVDFWDRFLNQGYNSIRYPTTPLTPSPLSTYTCPSLKIANRTSVLPYVYQYMVDLKQTQGTFKGNYSTGLFDPDALEIFYEGASIFATGTFIGPGNFSVAYGSATSKSTRITLKVSATNNGLPPGWKIFVDCPK